MIFSINSFAAFSCLSAILSSAEMVSQENVINSKKQKIVYYTFLLILLCFLMKVMQIIISTQDNKELVQKYCIFSQKFIFCGALKKIFGALKNRLRTLFYLVKTQTQVSTFPYLDGPVV